ncbi:hypothetical protein Syun_003604 [Stephania yunnanensis]|uniref:Uncharacterized protein n=1 Tax=Stephania yunnanensis TaxID=152371 RepID=A0AAP0L1F1_9MAGN
MGKESGFPGQNDINEESHVGGTKPLVSLVPFSFNEENQMNEERIEENCICENIEAPAEEGKHPGVFEPTGSSEMVDMNGLGRLAHAHVNPVFNELIPEESRPLKENLAQTEITDCVGGTYATDCGVDTIIQPQIVVVEPFQDCFSTEQSGTMDDRHWNEIFSSQHTEPRQSWSAIDDQNDFNHRGEGAGQEESVHTIDEPILDHLKMLQRNEVSFNVCEVHEHAASGTRLNTEGARHVDCIESEEVNTTSQVIPQAKEITVVGEAEKHLVYLAKEVQNDMGEHIAIMDEDGLHGGSTHQNGKESTERCVSRLENISLIAQKSEESRNPTATELGDNMEEERYGVGHVDDSTFSEDQDKKEDMMEYDPEPDELAGASSVLQQPRKSVLAELSIINDCGLCSPFEILTSSRSAGRNLDDRSVFFSGSIVSHHHNESQAVSSEAIVNDSEDVERASDAGVSVQSVSRNFSFGDFFENVQLSETFKLETSGKLLEKKGSDHVVEENEGTIEQYRESKLTELVVEEKLEANDSSAPEVKAAVQSCLIDFDVSNNEEASASLMAKYCTEYSEGRDTIKDENKRSINKIGPTSPFTSQVVELCIIKDAENEDVSSQTFTLELADYEDYDGRVHDGMEVAATLKEPTYDKITEKNSNAMVEENCIFMDSRVFVLEEETSMSPTEISSGAQKLLGSNEVHMKADLDGPTCNFDASENFGDQEYACQVFPENHCNNEDLNTEQYIRTNGSENAVLGDAIFDYSGAEIKGRAVDLEDLIETENISESSLERIKASGRSVRTSLCQAESGFQTEVDCNKDNSRMRKYFVSAVNVTDDRGGDSLELLQDCTSNADFPHLRVDQAEDQEGTNEACNANSTDQENDNNATFFRSPSTVEKEESNGPTPGSVVKEEIKGAMHDINSQLRKMHISSTIKWRGKASMTPKECKKSFETHDQLASNMKENITSMKCVKSGNCSEKQSAFKRRALKDLHGSKMRDQSCYTPYKQQ